MREFVFAAFLTATATSAAPDIREVEPDLEVPPLSEGEPVAGKRVTQAHPDYADTEVRHVLYLPQDWKPGGSYPVIVEYAGNGPYKNKFGDHSSGHVDGSKLGYGLSAGRGYIWLCIPYLNNKGTANVPRWWGDKGKHDPRRTIEYAKKVVPWVCEKYGGDPERVVLCGFSRGAIACNFIGLHEDEIAKLWCAFLPYSHYDGVNERWGYPGADRASAKKRLSRLGGRPQLIMHEGDGVSATRKYLETTGHDLSNITFAPTGFRNHDDAWTLRPSAAREQAREWLKAVVAESK